MSGRATYSSYITDRIPIPEGMKEGDVTCMDCRSKFKKGNKEEAKAEQAALKEEEQDLFKLTPEYKKFWNKDGIIQFKNDKIAILKRQIGRQVEFIIAYDQLTDAGYELKAIDEGKEGGEVISGGISSYYYFQRFHRP